MDNELLFILAAVGFFIWTLRSLLYWVDLWQRIQYRPSDFLTNLKARRKLLRYFFAPPSLLTWVSIIIALYVSIEDYPVLWYQLLILCVFGIKTLVVAYSFLKNELIRPKITARSSLVITFSLLTLILFFAIPLTERFLWLLILDRLKFFVIGGFIFLFTFPNELFEDFHIRKASKKIKKYKGLKIIIIASRSSKITSFFLTQLLEKKRNIYATTADSIPGIAHEVSQHVSDQIKYLVIAHPTSDELTLITLLQLFPPETVILSDDGKEILPVIVEHVEKSTKILLPEQVYNQYVGPTKKNKFLLYSLDSVARITESKQVVRAIQFKQKTHAFNATVILPAVSIVCDVPLIGQTQLQSLLPSIMMANYAEQTKRDIEKKVISLVPFPHTLLFHKTLSNITFIDNTGESSTESSMDGVLYAKMYKKKRIFIFGGYAEGLSDSEYIPLLKSAGSIFTHILFLSLPAGVEKKTSRIIKETNQKVIIISGDTRRVERFIRQEIFAGDIILFEGYNTRQLLNVILSNTSTKA